MDSIFLVVEGYFCFSFSKVAKVVRKKKHNLIAGTLLIKESGVLAEMINDQLELWSVFWGSPNRWEKKLLVVAVVETPCHISHMVQPPKICGKRTTLVELRTLEFSLHLLFESRAL